MPPLATRKTAHSTTTGSEKHISHRQIIRAAGLPLTIEVLVKRERASDVLKPQRVTSPCCSQPFAGNGPGPRVRAGGNDARWLPAAAQTGPGQLYRRHGGSGSTASCAVTAARHRRSPRSECDTGSVRHRVPGRVRHDRAHGEGLPQQAHYADKQTLAPISCARSEAAEAPTATQLVGRPSAADIVALARDETCIV
jgi:hypothetical protein